MKVLLPAKSFSSQHKGLLQVCAHVKSHCLQLFSTSPYVSAPGVQSGHYLGDATAPAAQVTW